MGRSAKYEKEDLERRVLYTIVVSDDAKSYSASLELSKLVIKEDPRKRVLLINGTGDHMGFDQVPYTNVQSFGSGKIRYCNTKGEPALNVIDTITKKFKHGLVIIGNEFIDNDCIGVLLESINRDNGLDFIMHRDSAFMYGHEKNLYDSLCQEIKKNKNTGEKIILPLKFIFRLHASPSFNINNLDYLLKLIQFYDTIDGMGIFASQYASNYKSFEVGEEIKKKVKYHGVEFEEIVNMDMLDYWRSQFTYYSLFSKKITNAPRDIIEGFMKKIASAGIFSKSNDLVNELIQVYL
jgi:hypothetical protein